jgi:hypothetical protein
MDRQVNNSKAKEKEIICQDHLKKAHM